MNIGAEAGVFTLRAELWDEERRMIYFGDVLVRLCSSISIMPAESATENFKTRMKTLHHRWK